MFASRIVLKIAPSKQIIEQSDSEGIMEPISVALLEKIIRTFPLKKYLLLLRFHDKENLFKNCFRNCSIGTDDSKL